MYHFRVSYDEEMVLCAENNNFLFVIYQDQKLWLHDFFFPMLANDTLNINSSSITSCTVLNTYRTHVYSTIVGS